MPDTSFAQWMVDVDRYLLKRLFLDSRDLPDVAYRDMFDDGMSPFDAAKAAIDDAGGGDLLDEDDV